MTAITTQYGTIKEYLHLETYESGTPASLMCTGRHELETPYGTLVPQYEVEDFGRKEHKHVLFHPNGTVRRVPLQDAQTIETDHGPISAEMLLFYNNGALKRLFPLTGKLSGYWTEANEFALAQDLTLILPSGTITAKMISIGFYKSGSVRSITLWPGETVDIKTPAGTVNTRTGISFHEDGSIKNLEPARPTAVKTAIGTIEAFDNDPEGVSGDMNSLGFDTTDRITALCTTSSQVAVTARTGEKRVYHPTEKASLCSESVTISVPLHIEFIGDTVRFNKNPKDEYPITECSFEIGQYIADVVLPTYEC